MSERITILESADGVHRYLDNETGAEMCEKRFIKRVELGDYPDYEIRTANGAKIPWKASTRRLISLKK